MRNNVTTHQDISSLINYSFTITCDSNMSAGSHGTYSITIQVRGALVTQHFSNAMLLSSSPNVVILSQNTNIMIHYGAQQE